MWGADVAELRTLAQQFGKASDTLLTQSTLLSNQINNNPSWKGQDAARFRSDWNGSHRAMLQQAVSALKQESKKLLENADQQEKASNAAPGSGGGPGVSAGVPGARYLGGEVGICQCASRDPPVTCCPPTCSQPTDEVFPPTPARAGSCGRHRCDGRLALKR